MIKKKKSEDKITYNKPDSVVEKDVAGDNAVVHVSNSISAYLPPKLEQEILVDNRVHFF